MASTGAELLQGDRLRRIKDKLATACVTAGGMLVLCTLMLIFGYLLYVIAPLFRGANITLQQQVAAPMVVDYASWDENAKQGWVFNHQGEVMRVDLSAAHFAQPLARAHLNQAAQGNRYFSATEHAYPLYGYSDAQGELQLFTLLWQNQKIEMRPLPKVQLPISQLTHFTMALRETDVVHQFILTVVASNATSLVVRSGLFDSELDTVAWDSSLQMPLSDAPIGLHVNYTGEQIDVLSADQLLRIDPHLKLIQQVSFAEVPKLLFAQNKPAQYSPTPVNLPPAIGMQLLAGESSILIRHQDGTISQWFELVHDGHRQLHLIRQFKMDAAVQGIVAEPYRKSFAAVDGKELALFYTTSPKALMSTSLWDLGAFEQGVFSHNGQQLWLLGAQQWQLLSVYNPHPEISFSALWQEVWYEHYPKPDYVWQSTAADDIYEPKISLVPVIFGTLKAAFYALLFAVPIALAGAIYTAFYMSAPMRRVVKPAIEMMEALPTVILGFLAGLWLAPLIERNLPAVLLLLVLFPLSVLVTGFLWHRLPSRWRNQMPSGLDAIVLLPVLIAVAALAFALSPWLEQLCFGGDMRVYLTDHWGIGFNQRNALVVGIAMGFAVIPTIFTIAEDAIFSVPRHLVHGSLALGATPWQTLVRVVLLTASPGIFSAVMMGLGRAVGETMIVLMATGNTPIMEWNVFEGLRTLSANIAIEMPESEVGSSHYRVLFLSAFVLFMFTFLFNTLAELVRQHLRKKYSNM
ncbi:hypothetical protein VST7929_00681 [Vibrio stylophorae]|uniref:ABC transmembrane type-1 domain-containing protein n=1 Tax=Vibrio stylophorae TaxID=659351 RepID=A0ABM8ZRA1_9VIBR|nr:ABC transporter permease subunit [Vibrio stylophorae]CAH0532834.1 hypothetical protein VST7929_00681 [Vibrio stylophorae]